MGLFDNRGKNPAAGMIVVGIVMFIGIFLSIITEGEFHVGFLVPLLIIIFTSGFIGKAIKNAHKQAEKNSGSGGTSKTAPRPRVVSRSIFESTPDARRPHSAYRPYRTPRTESEPVEEDLEMEAVIEEPDGEDARYRDASIVEDDYAELDMLDEEQLERRRRRKHEHTELVERIRSRQRPVVDDGEGVPPGHILCFNCGSVIKQRGRKTTCPNCGTEIIEQ